MPTLERLARQTAATESIFGIVRTMKALAAVNIPAAERAADSASAFHETVLDGLAVALRAMPKAEGAIPALPRSPGIVIAFGTDHGLCGGFNETVARAVCDTTPAPRILAVGGRLAGALEREGVAVERTLRSAAASDGLRALAEELILTLDAVPGSATAGVGLIHHRRTSGGATALRHDRLLPLDADFLTALAGRPWPGPRRPMVPVSAPAIFRVLARQHLAISLYRSGAQSLAAEHTTRLALMSHAERELDRRRDDLGAAHRRLRQAHITDELLDIVSGFEAIGAAPATT